jgi:hypothetical protein
MKRDLINEIKRIHSLTYGNQINEEFNLDFIKKFLDKLGIDYKKFFDDEKTDILITPTVDDLFKNLELIKKEGISLNNSGDTNTKKKIQSLQLGLILLGYDLSHGADGVFGDETKKALDEFIKSNMSQTSITESTTNVGPFKGDLENGPSNHSKRSLGNWQSDNAWDLFAPVGTTVNSFTKGIVTNVHESNSNNPKIFGTQVSIKGTDGYPNIFYTHIENVKLKKGDRVDLGDFIGTIKAWPNHKATHVHVGLPRGRHLRELLKNSDKIFTMSQTIKNTEEEPNEITPEIITKLIDMLKSKNLQDKDIASILFK